MSIDVDRQHRPAGSVALRPRDLAPQLLVEPATVEQAGQVVVVGEMLELALESLALGDVTADGGCGDDRAVGIADR